MFAWTAWRPRPMNPMPMRLLGAALPSAPNAEPGTNMGSANPLPAAMAAPSRKPRRVTLPAIDVVLAGCMMFSLLTWGSLVRCRNAALCALAAVAAGQYESMAGRW